MSDPRPKDARRTLAEFTLPSEPGNEREATALVVEAVRDLGLQQARLERLATAVPEATMNAMEHGNEYKTEKPVGVRVLASVEDLYVLITDQGGSAVPAAGGETPDLEAKLQGTQTRRGWGLFLIRNMVDEMNVSTDENHHTIELIVHLRGDDDDGTGV